MRNLVGVEKIKVAVVPFTDSREFMFKSDVDLEKNEIILEEEYKKLIAFLKNNGFDVIEPIKSIKYDRKWFGIRLPNEIDYCANYIIEKGASCVVAGLWVWTSPYLVVDLLKKVNLPIALYANNDSKLTGPTSTSAVGASLLEVGVNNHALVHQRFNTDMKELAIWIKAVSASEKLKESVILQWGTSYPLYMEYAMDDISYLKKNFIRDVRMEDQTALIQKSKNILENDYIRIEDFKKWLIDKKTKIKFSNNYFTKDVFDRQISLYFAAKDRLKELKEEKITGIILKCQPELSVCYKASGCFIPGFLPFHEDSEGEKESFPVMCESDIKGMMTSLLLKFINGKIPYFGDFIGYYNEGFLTISNCGSCGVQWAYNYENKQDILEKIYIEKNIEGRYGGAVGYRSNPGLVTVARFTRVNRKYYLSYLLGKTVNLNNEKYKKYENKFSKTWPQMVLEIDTDLDLFFKVAPTNHFVVTSGDITKELNYISKEFGIKTVNLNSIKSMEEYLDNIYILD